MDFTPAVSTGAVTVEPAAAKLLMPNTVRTVADILPSRNGPPNSFGSWWNVGSLPPRSG